MPKASELKRGALVSIDDAPHIVEHLQVQTPSARGGASLYKIRFRNVATKQKRDETCKGDTVFGEMDLAKREVHFSYREGDNYVFMDTEDYREFILSVDDLAQDRNYITEDVEGLRVLVSEGQVLAVELPATVELEIEACDPSMRGASATARTKPATLTTGLVVQVPEYLSPGERIRVETETGKFLGRA